MTIPCHLSRLCLFSMLKHDMDLDKFKSWNFHGILQENDGISIGFDLIFDQTPVKKTRENPCHILYRAYINVLERGENQYLNHAKNRGRRNIMR